MDTDTEFHFDVSFKKLIHWFKTSPNFRAIQDFVWGFVHCFAVVPPVVKNARVRAWHFQFLGILISGVVVVALVMEITLLPFRLFLATVHMIWGSYVSYFSLIDFEAFVARACLLLPLVMLTLMRWFFSKSIESIFFAGVSSSKHPRAEIVLDQLTAAAGWTLRQTTVVSLKRIRNYVMLTCTMFFLSSIPYLGSFAGTFFAYIFIRRVFGYVIGLGFAALMLLPATSAVALTIFSVWFVSRALMREMLTPYLCRVTYHNNTHIRNEFYRKHDAYMTGFCLPFAILFYATSSVLAPFLYGVLQAAIGELVVPIEAKRKRLDEDMLEPHPEAQELLEHQDRNC